MINGQNPYSTDYGQYDYIINANVLQTNENNKTR